MKAPKSPLLLIAALTTALLASTVQALPSDREKPIYIKADSAERNEQKGTTIYTGSVQIDQGTLRILADKVTIYSRGNDVERIIAVGQPAHMQQQPALDKNLVIARGNTITYQVGQEKVAITDNAFLEQDGSTTRAKRIDYDIAQGSAKTSGNQRVQMVLQPQKKNESGTDK